jgi:cellulose synthase operon protein C
MRREKVRRLFRVYKYALTCGCIVLAFAQPGFTQNKKRNTASSDKGLSSLKLQQDDEKANDMRALKTELLVASTEEKAIEQAQVLIKKYRGTSMEPDLQLRLAELYVRRARTDRFLEIHRKSEEMVQLAPQLIKAAQPRKHINQAISIYDMIERRWPRYAKLDQVIFNNAFANQQVSNNQKAERLFGKLIKDFPSSYLIPDAHLALGEMVFQRRQFDLALKHFQAIKNYPDSMAYPYGLYKAAWTYYNMQDAAAGLKELEAVVKYGRFVKEQGIDSRLDLRREALSDMALFFSDVHPARDAFGYFERQSGELDVSPYMLRLAELYKRHSRHQDTRVILTEFIRRRPHSDYVPTAYVELMDASEKTKRRKDVVNLMEGFYGVCSENSNWSKRQDVNYMEDRDSALFSHLDDSSLKLTPAMVCQNVFNRTALTYANKWLKEWQGKTSDKELGDLTEKIFEIYLKRDNKSEEANRARFVYAELLFKRDKFREASHHYTIAGSQTTDEKLGHDSRYFAIVALEKATNDKWSNSDEQKLKTLAGDYLKNHGNGKFALDLQFKMAFIAYDKKRYDEAAPVLLKLGQDYPRHELGVKSQDLYLDILNIKKDYAALKDYAAQLKTGTKNKERLRKLNQIYEESYFATVQGLEESKRYAEAIEGYSNFAKENPKSNLAQKGLLNIIELYYKTGNLLQGAQAAVHYYDSFPNSKESVDALLKSAQTYESMGQLKEASDVLIKLSKADPKQEERWLMLSADFMVLSGNFQQAKPVYEKILKSSNADNSFRSLEQLERIAQRTNNIKDREDLLRKISETGRQPQASTAQLYFVEKAWNEKNYEQAFTLARRVVGTKDRGVSRHAQAKARLIQARILDHEFRSQSLRSQLERVHLVLQLKTEKLEKAQIAYQAAARYGDPQVTVLAMRELAEAYKYYSSAIKDMPLPNGVPQEEEVLFRNEINKLAFPMEDKAIETMSVALNRAKSSRVRDGSVTEIQMRLNELSQQPSYIDPLSVVSEPSLQLPNSEGVGS